MGSSCQVSDSPKMQILEKDIYEKEGRIQRPKQMCTKIVKIGYLHERLDEAQNWEGLQSVIFVGKKFNIISDKHIPQLKQNRRKSQSSESKSSNDEEKQNQFNSLQKIQNNLAPRNSTLKPSSFRKIPKTSNQIDF